jgi:hypothetical protein
VPSRTDELESLRGPVEGAIVPHALRRLQEEVTRTCADLIEDRTVPVNDYERDLCTRGRAHCQMNRAEELGKEYFPLLFRDLLRRIHTKLKGERVAIRSDLYDGRAQIRNPAAGATVTKDGDRDYGLPTRSIRCRRANGHLLRAFIRVR